MFSRGCSVPNVDFCKFFRRATSASGCIGGLKPLPFQRRFAASQSLPALLDIPTGLGKTATAILGWLYRRHQSAAAQARTPRRLVYCLPMRVLVEQTRDHVRKWIDALRAAGLLSRDVGLHVLMGGESADDWEASPERDAIIVGTQDMLLSRALNRGYAASRARWPMQFGLLHIDCLWVFDEVQLMGAGLTTSAQLEALRSRLSAGGCNNGCRSLWMSATVQQDWLRTVDFDAQALPTPMRLDAEDLANPTVAARWKAAKPLQEAPAAMDQPGELAAIVRDAHQPGTRTLVILNTVRRAVELHDKLKKLLSGRTQRAKRGESLPTATPTEPASATPGLVLLHSRFRPPDRDRQIKAALHSPDAAGTIIVSTQVVEAGVDLDAVTLFTELAPWASLVQRFGRCNRRGEHNDHARACWIDLPSKAADARKFSLPYDSEDLSAARQLLERCAEGVGPAQLADLRGRETELFDRAMRRDATHVLRRKDLIDLFDTTPDLAGNDIDIDRFVREVDQSDVRVFWRDCADTPNETDDKAVEPAPRREELCPAPIGEFRKFATDQKRKGKVWRWNVLERKWETVDSASITPGQVYMVHSSTGGYDPERGWDKKGRKPVTPVAKALSDAPTDQNQVTAPESYEDDPLTRRAGTWVTIGDHCDEVVEMVDAICRELALDGVELQALRLAARYHDWGKAHKVFRAALPDDAPDSSKYWAKAPGRFKRYERPYFRHELASALGVLIAHTEGRLTIPAFSPPPSVAGSRPTDPLDLVIYLIAAHHGKVRLSIRSLPGEKHPETQPGRIPRFARGVWDGDELPQVDLGGGVRAPAVRLSLEPMELGLCQEPPLAGQPSWAERMIRLRDALGPFRLAYLEALLRAADWRASAPGNSHATGGEDTHE